MFDSIPKTLLEATAYFAVPAHCNDFMREIKWPGGKIVCPKCGNESCKEIASRPGTIKCNKAACQKQFSFKVGTIFEDSPLGLDKWFVAVWAIANCRNGISSHELGRAIGVTQKTAWAMSLKINLALEWIMEQGVEFREVAEAVGYRVGSDGSAWSCWRKGPGALPDGPWRLLHPVIDREGYGRIEIRDAGGIKSTRKVCSLVCIAFHGPRPDGQECRHKDGDSSNNAANNLAWGTSLENHADKRTHGTVAKGERHGKVKLTQGQIDSLLALKGTITQQSAADRFGVSRGYVGQLWSGNRQRVPV